MSETLMSMIAAAKSDAREIEPTDAAAALDAGAYQLVVDVREPKEYQDEHLPDAINIPRGILELRADPASPSAHPELSTGQTDRILVYCTKGPGFRSLVSAQTLRSMGFENVEVLGGGLAAWGEAGLPTAT